MLRGGDESWSNGPPHERYVGPENARRIVAALKDLGFGGTKLQEGLFLKSDQIIRMGIPLAKKGKGTLFLSSATFTNFTKARHRHEGGP